MVIAPIAAAYGFPSSEWSSHGQGCVASALSGLGEMVAHNPHANPGSARLMVKQGKGRRFLP